MRDLARSVQFKNVKKAHRRVLLLVKLQASDIKSCKASHFKQVKYLLGNKWLHLEIKRLDWCTANYVESCIRNYNLRQNCDSFIFQVNNYLFKVSNRNSAVVLVFFLLLSLSIFCTFPGVFIVNFKQVNVFCVITSFFF